MSDSVGGGAVFDVSSILDAVCAELVPDWFGLDLLVRFAIKERFEPIVSATLHVTKAQNDAAENDGDWLTFLGGA